MCIIIGSLSTAGILTVVFQPHQGSDASIKANK
jgi:hypothetical protein